jgi:hypothetical protein
MVISRRLQQAYSRLTAASALAPLQPRDMPSARAPDDRSRPRLTCPQALNLTGHKDVSLLDGQSVLDEAIDEAQ